MADVDNENNDIKPATADDGDDTKEDASSPTTAHRPDPSVRHVFANRDEISELYDVKDDYPQFELIPKDVCLDPHDEDNNFMYCGFRAKDGSRLTREIVDQDFILVGNDKAGLSGVLSIPVPPGATLSVQMSTWCNPCHSDYGVEKSSCFGVGMVPFGSGKEQMWSRAGLETVIEDGVQYHACMAYEKMMFGGGGGRLGTGGLGGMAALLGGGGSPDNLFEYSLDVMQEGTSIRHSSKTKLSLEVIDVRIRRDAAGVSEFSFSHGDDLFKVKRPVDTENKDMQLYFNCLGWADNNTYVKIHKVVYEPPPSDEKPSAKSAGDNVSKKRALETIETEVEFPDYAKILKGDPELRKQVDELINSKQGK